MSTKPTDVSEEVWISFLTIRKAKRMPITELGLLAIRREAVKAGIDLDQALTVCCERGWASFKAEWMHKDQPAKRESYYEAEQRAKRKQWEEMTGRKWPSEPGAIIEMEEDELKFLQVKP